MSDCSSNQRTPLELTELTKDEELWFDDGNIVLVAESTAFRLYKGPLSTTSPVFRDLFSFKGSKDQEILEGCPAVRLHDSATHLRHFLRMLYMPGFALLHRDYRPSFEALSAVIRIGHKYQADDAVDAAASRLSAFFDTFGETAGSLMHSGNGQATRSDTGAFDTVWRAHQAKQRIEISVEDAIEALNLARLCNLPEVVPLALLLCCADNPVHLRTGVLRQDGTTASLSDEDFVRCIKALPLLTEALREVVVRTLKSLPPMDPREFSRPVCSCKSLIEGMLDALGTEHIAGAVTNVYVRFDMWESPPVAWTAKEKKLCKSCRAQLLGSLGKGYPVVWEKLFHRLRRL